MLGNPRRSGLLEILSRRFGYWGALCDSEHAATKNFGARQPPATCIGKHNKNGAGHCPAQLRARFCVPPARTETFPRCQSVMLRFTRSNDRSDGMNTSPGARFGARLQNFLENVVWII